MNKMDSEDPFSMISDEENGNRPSHSKSSSSGSNLFKQKCDLSMSDISSVLSDPPSDVELVPNFAMNKSLDQFCGGNLAPEPLSRFQNSQKRLSSQTHSKSGQNYDTESEFEVEEDLSDWERKSADAEIDSDFLDKGPLEELFHLKARTVVSQFENLSYEIFQIIVAYLSSDSDLVSLILTCHTFARQLQPENSCVWKMRFLQKYDYPIIESSFDFCVAYKLRALLLPRFVDIGFGKKKNAGVLLEMIKDMVLETYNTAFPWQSASVASRNISAFSNATRSAWMVHFLSTPFFGRDQKETYGHPHELFDALQVVFSHLVLNRSAMTFQVGRDKSDYDLEKVYRFDQRLALLCTQVSDQLRKRTQLRSNKSTLPKKRKEDLTPRVTLRLDVNTLLHIRNFWHRHLTETKAISGEETYGNMAARLNKIGIKPKAWVRPLHQRIDLNCSWYGHYSCIYPWPKTSKLLREKESEAEVWDNVDPLHLDFSVSHDDTNDAWPQIFATIPALAKTLDFILDEPERHNVRYLRGLAPFQVVEHIKSPQPQHTLSVTHHHPFTRLRLRGVVHDLPDQAGIPGWRRVVMVLYRPLWRELVEIFDYATEYYGEPFQQQLHQTFGTNLANMTHEQLEEQYAIHLTALLANLKGPVEMSRGLIDSIEDHCYGPGRELAWDDIEHAYAYEGVITPGGMVMLGRWWRIGPPTATTNGEEDGQEYGDSVTGWERGPFCFWAA